MRSSQAVLKYVIENKYTLKYTISICSLFNRFIMDPHFITYNRKSTITIIFKSHYIDCSYPKIKITYSTIFVIYYHRVLFIWIYNYYLFT